MEKVLDEMGIGMFGKSRTEAVTENVCIACKKPAKNFRDPISVREFKISGLCQECQDAVFNPPEDEYDEPEGEYYSSLEDPQYR